MHRSFERLTQITNDSVQECIPREWDEDFITLSLLRAMRTNFNNIEIEGLNYPIKVVSGGAYKLTGKNENQFGDVALIFLFNYAFNRRFYGCGFLEAKKRDSSTANFPAIKVSQLQRILRNAPAARLMLYDTDLSVPVMPVSPSWPLDPFIIDFFHHRIRNRRPFADFPACVHCPPMSLALQVRDFSIGMLRFSLPFSYQFLFRYVMGYDLEFSEKALKIATGRDPEKRPDFIVIYKVLHGTDTLAPEGIQINREGYEAIE